MAPSPKPRATRMTARKRSFEALDGAGPTLGLPAATAVPLGVAEIRGVGDGEAAATVGLGVRAGVAVGEAVAVAAAVALADGDTLAA